MLYCLLCTNRRKKKGGNLCSSNNLDLFFSLYIYFLFNNTSPPTTTKYLWKPKTKDQKRNSIDLNVFGEKKKKKKKTEWVFDLVIQEIYIRNSTGQL